MSENIEVVDAEELKIYCKNRIITDIIEGRETGEIWKESLCSKRATFCEILGWIGNHKEKR